MQKSISLLCFLLLFCGGLWAQEAKMIKGVVTEQSTGEPLIGVSVVEVGTINGTTTDIDGRYELTVKGDKVTFSYVGFSSETVTVATAGEYNIRMKDNTELDEVIVVGYGVQRKSDLTGAISSISSKDIKNYAVSNVSELLAGKASGVFVAASSGQPGSTAVVRIRGLGTMNDNNPLYVVDGQFMDNINNLNPNDIDRMEVLKDASALAIYGSRGSNGVIIVTTKSGVKGETIVTLDMSVGMKSSYKALDMMNSDQFYNFILSSYANDPSFTAENRQKFTNQYNRGYNTDWWKEVTRTALNQNYNVSVRKGTEDSRTALSIGYLGDQGAIKTTEFNRISLRLSQEYDIKDVVTVGTTINIAKIKQKDADALPSFSHIQNADPFTPVINPLVDPASENYQYNKYAPTEWAFNNNPVATLMLPNRHNDMLNVFGNVFANVKLAKGLSYRFQYSFERNHDTFKNFEPIFESVFTENNLANPVKYNRDTKLTNNSNVLFNQIYENRVNYNYSSGRHRFDAMAAVTYEQRKHETIEAFKTTGLNNNPEHQILGSMTTGDQVNGIKITESLMSYLGRLNYAYDDKYLATVNFRADGSSKFAKENRWGYFPSLSLGWRITNEDFFKELNTDKWLSDLKLRAGWGRNGNQRIDQNAPLMLVSSGKEDKWYFGNVPTTGYYLKYSGNRFVKWETSEQTNIGLDASFFNGSLTMSMDVYQKTTRDMLLGLPLPAFGGYPTNPYMNAGELKNTGFEFSANYRNSVGKDFQYSAGLNLSTYKTETTGLNINGKNLEYLSAGLSRTYIGDPFGKFWGYKHIGIFQSQAEVDNYVDSKGNKIQPKAEAGDFKFAKLSGDGELNDDDDRTFVGDPNPDLIFGFNLGFVYKNVDLTMAFQGTLGNDIWNTSKGTFGTAGNKNALAEAYTKAWRQEGDNAKYPRMSSQDNNNNFRGSSFYVEDGSYLRLQNVQLGYTLPAHIAQKTKVISSCRVFVTGQNLFTITGYSGLDPELGVNSPLEMGVDNTRYPSSRIVTFGVNLQF